MKKGIFAIIIFFSVLVSRGAALADSEFDAALKEYYSGHYNETVIRLKAYVEKRPDAPAYYLIGYSLYKLDRFKEADEYFKEAYLIDPGFSPEQLGLRKGIPSQSAPKKARKHAASKAAAATGKSPSSEPAKKLLKVIAPKNPEPKRAPAKTPAPALQAGTQKAPRQSAVQPKADPHKNGPIATAPKNMPPQEASPLPRFPQAFNTKRGTPGMALLLAIPLILGSFLAGFFLIALAIGIASYVYGALCLFLIAKKRDVAYPWTAWIPLVQVWPFVGSAGKPAWWIILLFIPLVNIIISIYLWICITKYLGRNKWLGLLMILPLINFVFLGILAFSKSEQPSSGLGEGLAE
jgi:tetratricopeptide (TPR) repeat protein